MFARPFVLDSTEQAAVLKRKISWAYAPPFGIILFNVFIPVDRVVRILVTAAFIIAFTTTYVVWVRRNTRGLERGDLRLRWIGTQTAAAAVFPRRMLWLLSVSSLVLAAGSATVLVLDKLSGTWPNEDLWPLVLAIVFFGAGGFYLIFLLRLNSREKIQGELGNNP